MPCASRQGNVLWGTMGYSTSSLATQRVLPLAQVLPSPGGAAHNSGSPSGADPTFPMEAGKAGRAGALTRVQGGGTPEVGA